METDADTRSQALIEVRDPYGRVRRMIEGSEGDGNPTGRPTVPTNLNPWKLPETELPTKEHTQVLQRLDAPA